MAKKFTQIPEELFEHVLWEKASNDYKMVLITILRHTAFEDQNKANLKKGQCQKSVREIAKEAKTSKSTAEHAIDHFIGLNSHKKVRGDVPAQSRRILERQKERQKERREKQVYNILLNGFYESGETESETESETRGETKERQKRDNLPGKKQTTDEDEEIVFKKDVRSFRGCGNVDNSQASYQHSPQPSKSPFSQKANKPSTSSSLSSENTSEESLLELVFARIATFKLMDGSSLKNQSIQQWSSRHSHKDMLLILDWFDAMQKKKFAQGEILTEAYLQDGITQGWWKIWAKRKFAKEQDEKQAEKQRG